MKRKFKEIAATLIFLNFASVTLAGNSGTSGASLLHYNFNPRAEGMAEAWVAVADDAQSVYWNPAGLAFATRNQISTTLAKGLVDDYFGQVSGAYTLDPDITLAAGLLAYSGGIFERTDDAGNSQRVLAQTDYLLALSGSYLIDGSWAAGATVELLHSTLLERVSGLTAALTLGASYKPDFLSPLRLGLAVRNLGFPLRYNGGEGDPLPMTAQLGAAYKILDSTAQQPLHDLVIALDGNWSLDTPIYANLGAEYWFQKSYALRLGYKFNRDLEGFTCGLGANIFVFKDTLLQLDYSLSLTTALDYAHKLAVTWYLPENPVRWTKEKWAAKIKAEQEAKLRQQQAEEAAKKQAEEEKRKAEEKKQAQENKPALPPLTLAILEIEQIHGQTGSIILNAGFATPGVVKNAEGVIYNPGREMAGVAKIVEVYRTRSRAIITETSGEIKPNAVMEIARPGSR